MEAADRSLYNKLNFINDTISSLLSVHGILIIIAVFFVVAAVLFFLQSFYRTRLLHAAASGGQKNNSVWIVFSSVGETLGKIVQNFPVLGGILIVIFVILIVARIIFSINDFIEREKRIKQLTVAIKYMEQNEKVIAVRVLSIDNGITKLRLDYSAQDSGDTSIPRKEWRKEISIEGTDIFFDCMVFNFSYSEITSGRQKNIAIPYRVYSNKVAPENGISLSNLVCDIPDEDNYGDIPPVYGERLKQLMEDEEFRKEMGVRSVNGSAPHRYVSSGERFTVKVENSGGVNIY
jgi:hypothetical protein